MPSRLTPNVLEHHRPGARHRTMAPAPRQRVCCAAVLAVALSLGCLGGCGEIHNSEPSSFIPHGAGALVAGANTTSSSLIGGKPADAQTHPAVGAVVVSIRTTNGTVEAFTCTGTLIAPDVVLTAWHCISKDLLLSELQDAQHQVAASSIAFQFMLGADVVDAASDDIVGGVASGLTIRRAKSLALHPQGLWPTPATVPACQSEQSPEYVVALCDDFNTCIREARSDDCFGAEVENATVSCAYDEIMLAVQEAIDQRSLELQRSGYTKEKADAQAELDITTWIITLGIESVVSEDDKERIVVDCVDEIAEALFPHDSLVDLGDIGLMFLDRPIPCIEPARLADENTPIAIDETVRAVGYGDDGSGHSAVKRHAAVRITQITDGSVAAGSATEARACHGDSGGPVFAEETGGPGPTLLGVASRLLGSAEGCNTGVAYIRPAHVLSWLDTRIVSACHEGVRDSASCAAQLHVLRPSDTAPISTAADGCHVAEPEPEDSYERALDDGTDAADAGDVRTSQDEDQRSSARSDNSGCSGSGKGQMPHAWLLGLLVGLSWVGRLRVRRQS